MTKLAIIRKAKSLLMRWRVDRVVQPVSGLLLNMIYIGQLSRWRHRTPVRGYNDWYQRSWDYQRRFRLYEAISQSEGLARDPLDYFEFGVCGGFSFRWWLAHNSHPESHFYGFDTFEGLPEAFGPFGKGEMAVSLESLEIVDPRARFYKGLFQDTLVPFLDQYPAGRRKLIHLDADLFSSTLFALSQLYRFLQDGDILLFDEFAVPRHEFRAFQLFTESFYVQYEVIGAANNYLFVAVKIKKHV